MAYRNGTYVAFHAGGTANQAASDIRYYRTLQMWHKDKNTEFRLIDSHDKTASVRDSSLKRTLETRLKQRLNRSKNMLLIVTSETKKDTDWVPFEIRYAVDDCEIPIIAAYPGCEYILNPNRFKDFWPTALKYRIENNSANVIHIPFKQLPIADAIDQFGPNNVPNGGGLGYYGKTTYKSWGMI